MQNCVRCHERLVSGIHNEGRKCWDCHRSLPHGY
jgi:cytochrome c nitrite reductase small subunit